MIEDVRQAVRSMVRRPGFTLVVLATFALGIGANTAIFSVVDGVLWQQLPYRDADRLVTIWERDLFSGEQRLDIAPANFLDLREQTTALSDVAYGRPVDREVIGVAGDVRQTTLLEGGRADVYTPHAESGVGGMTLVVRTRGGASAMEHASTIQKAIWDINPTLPIYSTHAMADRLRDSLEHRRFVLSLVTSFALLALVLAAVGIYGILSFHTNRRIPEIGIRAALGAQRRQIASLVLGDALRLAAAGIAAGLAIALVLTRFLEGMLFGISRQDPITFVASAVILATIAIAACLLPLRRALQVDPAVALRVE